uniref:phosphoacetylglucosamine mutase n=1 Tax=Caenorhabditis japonica TaxID=281687 RepID=A0A8R1E995_CAEJA
MSEIVVPPQFSRNGNTTHKGNVESIPDAEQFSYGTAGFRFEAEKLPFLVFRCAYVASLRARQLDSAIGVMITASHNPAKDNGVKLVDPSGDMLNEMWEKYSTEIVNATDAEFPEAVRRLEEQIVVRKTENSRVVCGMDTRESGPHLMEAARAGAALFGVLFEDIGVVSTPILHYVVKCHNEPKFAEPTKEAYYSAISGAFNELYRLTDEPEGSRYQNKIVLDCANGVGAPRFRDLLEKLDTGLLDVEFRNETGELNHQCGADYVKIRHLLPENFNSAESLPKCASFDGDADRLIYFRPSATSNAHAELFDGDKIAVLIATYIREQLRVYDASGPKERLRMGIVQTAYANGSSTRPAFS